MFTGRETPEYTDDPENIRTVVVGYMLNRDPSLLEPLKEGIGAVFERTSAGSDWRIVTDWSAPDDDGSPL